LIQFYKSEQKSPKNDVQNPLCFKIQQYAKKQSQKKELQIQKTKLSIKINKRKEQGQQYKIN
jgi:hypothetical protein